MMSLALPFFLMSVTELKSGLVASSKEIWYCTQRLVSISVFSLWIRVQVQRCIIVRRSPKPFNFVPRIGFGSSNHKATFVLQACEN